jgi:hypothetical protein
MVKLRPLTLEKPVEVGADVVVELEVVFEVVFEVDEVEVVLEVVVVNVEDDVVVAVPEIFRKEMRRSSNLTHLEHIDCSTDSGMCKHILKHIQ